MSVAERVAEVINGPVSQAGFTVEDVTVHTAGSRRLVRVLVDRAVTADADDTTSRIAPVSLDEVAEATRAVDDALEGTDVMGSQAYTLEVSSAGVSRPLTHWRHFRRNVGRLLELTTGQGPVTGRLMECASDTLTVVTPAQGKRPAVTHEVAIADITRAIVTIEFGRLDDPDDQQEPASRDGGSIEEES